MSEALYKRLVELEAAQSVCNARIRTTSRAGLGLDRQALREAKHLSDLAEDVRAALEQPLCDAIVAAQTEHDWNRVQELAADLCERVPSSDVAQLAALWLAQVTDPEHALEIEEAQRRLVAQIKKRDEHSAARARHGG